MVEVWGSALSLVGNALGTLIDIILLDAFLPRKRLGKPFFLFVVAGGLIVFLTLFSLLLDSGFGYAFKILFEVAAYYVLCAILYESRWDRRLLIVVTLYAILYSSTYWTDTLCMAILHLTYEEYVWNIPLYSAMFLIRPIVLLAIALIIRKYHQPLAVGKQTRAWVPLTAVFPAGTLLVIWQVYTHPGQQQTWQICLLILDAVDVAALLLLDHLEQSALNRERLLAADVRAHVQDENIEALSQAYAGQRKMTHDYRAQLSTLSELLETGEVEDAKAYLAEMKARQSERILLINTHNAAIDAVLNQKGYQGRQLGIDLRFRVNDLSALRLPRVDVTVVLGNLIDNALEACQTLKEADRWVSIQLLYSHDTLSISIINPSNPVQIQDGEIPTTKAEPLLHGFGLRNVRDILDKYKAEYTISYEDGRFVFLADWPDTDLSKQDKELLHS